MIRNPKAAVSHWLRVRTTTKGRYRTARADKSIRKISLNLWPPWPPWPAYMYTCEIWKCELEAVGRHCDLASRCWQTLLISPNLDSHTLSSDASSSSWPSSYSDHYPVRIITWSMIHSHPLNATLQSHMSKTVIICNAQSFVKDSKIWTRSLWHKFFQLFPPSSSSSPPPFC